VKRAAWVGAGIVTGLAITKAMQSRAFSLEGKTVFITGADVGIRAPWCAGQRRKL